MSFQKRQIYFATPWYRERLHRGILRYAHEQRWRVALLNPANCQLFANRKPDGVISALFPDAQKPLTRCVLDYGCPLVELTKELQAPGIARVLERDEEIGRMAAEFFLHKEAASFLYVSYAPNLHSDDRWQGFSSRLAAHAAPVSRCEMPALQLQKNPARALQSILKKLPKPVGAFCVNDGIAEEFEYACMEAHIGIPEDVMALSYNNYELACDWAPVPISSIDNNEEERGYAAAKLLDAILNHKKRRDTTLTFPPGEIVERTSTERLAVSDPVIYAALTFLRENCHRLVPVAEVAKAVGIPRPTLELRFRQHLGSSIAREALNFRIEKAKRLLTKPGMKIAAIATELGFNDAAAFMNTFRRNTGMTAIQHRETHMTERSPSTQRGAATSKRIRSGEAG